MHRGPFPGPGPGRLPAVCRDPESQRCARAQTAAHLGSVDVSLTIELRHLRKPAGGERTEKG